MLLKWFLQVDQFDLLEALSREFNKWSASGIVYKFWQSKINLSHYEEFS